jgi:HPt (histidine-containing phosphotransfer) domain-containing protein
MALAHALKGSARSIGAFRVAELAERIEAKPADKAALTRLGAALSEVRDFIAAISR